MPSCWCRPELNSHDAGSTKLSRPSVLESGDSISHLRYKCDFLPRLSSSFTTNLKIMKDFPVSFSKPLYSGGQGAQGVERGLCTECSRLRGLSFHFSENQSFLGHQLHNSFLPSAWYFVNSSDSSLKKAANRAQGWGTCKESSS